MARKSRVLTDHDEIRSWAEERDARPACVRDTGTEEDVGMIRLDFPGYRGETSLEPIEWDEWLQKFDDNNLALLVEDETGGGEQSNFNQIIGRETAAAQGQGRRKTSRRAERRAEPEKSRPSRSRPASSARGNSRRASRAGARRAAASGSSGSRSGRPTSARGSTRSSSRSKGKITGKKRAQSARSSSRSRSRRRAA